MERRVLSNGESSPVPGLFGGGRFSLVLARRSRGYLLLRIDLASREHRFDETKPRVFDLLLAAGCDRFDDDDDNADQGQG